jgi:hypothetical protein
MEQVTEMWEEVLLGKDIGMLREVELVETLPQTNLVEIPL